MNAREFYKLFRENFSKEGNEAVNRAYEDKNKDEKKILNHRQWTVLIADVLENMRLKSGYEKETELKIAGGRIDEKWLMGREAIYIEHENSDSVDNIVQKEVKNLLNADSDLRVLITYFEKQEDRRLLKARIKEKLNDEKRGKDFEFLLIMGLEPLEDPEDWEAYLFEPSFEVKALDSMA